MHGSTGVSAVKVKCHVLSLVPAQAPVNRLTLGRVLLEVTRLVLLLSVIRLE
jgi:hypothetical protein